MSQALHQVIESPTDGMFNPACFIHCDFNATSPMIGNLSYFTAFKAWYEGNVVDAADDCGVLCNPTCAH